jgi:hypothetical protein
VGAKPCTGTGSKPAQEKLAKKPLKLLDAADDRMRQKMVQSASKGTIYENCELQDPSGLLIGRISGKKMSWYLNLGLADQVYVYLSYKILSIPAGRASWCRANNRLPFTKPWQIR